MVCNKNVAALRIQPFNARHVASHGAERQQHARPDARYPVLREAGAVPQRRGERNGAHQDGGCDDCWCRDNGRAEFPHNNKKLKSIIPAPIWQSARNHGDTRDVGCFVE